MLSHSVKPPLPPLNLLSFCVKLNAYCCFKHCQFGAQNKQYFQVQLKSTEISQIYNEKGEKCPAGKVLRFVLLTGCPFVRLTFTICSTDYRSMCIWLECTFLYDDEVWLTIRNGRKFDEFFMYSHPFRLKDVETH